MGKTFSKTYSPNPKSGKSTCCSCLPCRPSSKPPSPAELPRPPIQPTDGPVDPSALLVKNIDLFIKANSTKHHTNEYHLVEKPNPNLVIRRGQSFNIKITFSKQFDVENNDAVLVFTAKDTAAPSFSTATLISVPIFQTANPSSTEWSAHYISVQNSSADVQVSVPANTIVGAWSLEIDIKPNKDLRKATRYPHPDPIYIIFNPWCKDDTVYMKDEDKLQEYVLNDNGLVWRGSHSRMRPSPWNHAQFEENILECAIYILNHVGRLRKSCHNDPIMISRHLSAVVNAQDDEGVVEGNWSGDYSGGEPPTKWLGSMVILQQFYKTKKPVKYGQCWVFAGVLTTVCRSLGIPARTVTNFSSAHDTQESLTVDIFCDDEGSVMDNLSRDSIWNFHVWNEAWMSRPDLEPGDYGGWQAIDSTPQEESDGIYRCGPSSVTAIKQGEIKKSYDVPFLFAEVNADKVYWLYRGSTQPLKLISKEQESIGMFISTKAIGSFEREDITLNYKYPERSAEERSIMLAALKQSGSMYSRYYLNEDFEDVSFDFHLYDDIVIGDSFKVVLKMKNKNRNKSYDVITTLNVNTMLYNGTIKSLIKRKAFDTHVRAHSDSSVILEVQYPDYESKLEDQCAFHISAMAKVKETDFEYFAQDDFRVRMPDIIIETDDKIIQGQEFSGKVFFKNPLPKALHNGEFAIEGAGLGTPSKIKMPNVVNPGEDISTTFKMIPTMPGSKTIVAKFNSKELNDVDGYKTINVSSKSPRANDPHTNDIWNGRNED